MQQPLLLHLRLWVHQPLLLLLLLLLLWLRRRLLLLLLLLWRRHCQGLALLLRVQRGPQWPCPRLLTTPVQQPPGLLLRTPCPCQWHFAIQGPADVPNLVLLLVVLLLVVLLLGRGPGSRGQR
jgi:hypothetical protein